MNTSKARRAISERQSPKTATIVASVAAPAPTHPDPGSRAKELDVAELVGLVAQSSRAVSLLLALPPSNAFTAAPANAFLKITGRLENLVSDLDKLERRST